MTSETIAEHGTTPDWPIEECTIPAHQAIGVHYHVTHGGSAFRAEHPEPLWNPTVHETGGWRTCQGRRFKYGHRPTPTRRTLVNVEGGERLTRAMCDGRTVTIEFIADRHSDGPLVLRRGCQSFQPGLALNNGGSVIATDNPDQFFVSMMGTVVGDEFTVKTRVGGTRSVSLGDLNGAIKRAWIEPETEEFVELPTGVYACTNGMHTHGVFLLSTTDRQPVVVRVSPLPGRVRVEKSATGFDHWPDCRPVLSDSYLSIFGPSPSRERPLKVKVTPSQFPTMPRVS